MLHLKKLSNFTEPAQRQKTVLCFCKYPDPGSAKLRLASCIGEELAVAIYRTLLEHTVHTISKGNHSGILYCYPDTGHEFFRYCSSRYHVPLYSQQGDDLGGRMFHAIASHLNESRYVVLVGSDCPELGPAYIRRAFQLLAAGNDIVLAPTLDGGYALIGARKIARSIFDGISWSSGQVLQQTRDKILGLGWRHACLPEVRDIDTVSDYCYFLQNKFYKHLFSAVCSTGKCIAFQRLPP